MSTNQLVALNFLPANYLGKSTIEDTNAGVFKVFDEFASNPFQMEWKIPDSLDKITSKTEAKIDFYAMTFGKEFDLTVDELSSPTQSFYLSHDFPRSLNGADVSSTLQSDSTLEGTLENSLSNDLLLEFQSAGLKGETIGETASLAGFNYDQRLYNDPIEYGNPLADAVYWRQQQGANACAVVAQICVYQSLTGQLISEEVASTFAQQKGWFDPLSGTLLEHTGHILDELGIPTYEMYNASFYDLQNALARGDKPIVGLDANEIWSPQYDWYGNSLEQTNGGHAVWVTGIDYEWNGSIGIILNDSGTPNGMASIVNYGDFMNAWQDYNYFLSVADNPLT
ncbi:MAG: hypothetical protein ACFCVD_03185 [Nodosilinea sp.]